MITISVIIPCKNEERHIAACINALLKQCTENAALEFIAVDNGSTDNTIEILKRYEPSIKVLRLPHGTISEVRNYGARRSRGEWLAFVDADVEVGLRWCANLLRTLSNLSREGVELTNVITGSTYAIPQKPSWVERVWFEQLKSRDKKSHRYINGGNLIIHRNLFERISGFNPAYRTGEDEKLCTDAVAQDAYIFKDSSIEAVHHGYPKSIKDFFKRERWHGLGMINNLSKPWRSRDLTLALYFLIASIYCFISIFFTTSPIQTTLIILAFLYLPLFILAVFRCIYQPTYIIPLTILYFIYGWARVFSLFDVTKRHFSIFDTNHKI